MQPKAIQLDLNDDDRKELSNRIRDDWTADSQDLEERGIALERWTRLWRAAAVTSREHPVPEQEGSNFSIPLIPWQIYNSLAKELSALFGDDAEIIVRPRGKTDVKNARKIKLWMEWRVKKSLRLFKKYADFVALKKIYGTAIAYLQWTVRKRKVKILEPEKQIVYQPGQDPLTRLPIQIPVEEDVVREVEKEITEFEGLDFRPENIEDWVIPKTATKLELGDPDHFSRRLYLSVEEILELRDTGKLDRKIWKDDEKFTETLYKLAETGKADTVTPDAGKKVRQVKDELSSQPSVPQGRENKIVLTNWFGRFRLRKNGKREERAEHVVAFYIPVMEKLIGACRLVDIFPDGQLPFLKSDALRDPNRFWGIGFCELLEDISNEMDCIHNITTDAGLMGVGPMGFYKPLSGVKAEKFRYEPWMMVPTNDPKNDVYFPTTQGVNMSPYVALMPQLLAMAERVTGLTETQLGRQFSGPNAPRTYGQQAMLQAESNQRVFLDLQLEREAFSELLSRIWEADKRWITKPQIFRVVEEDITMSEDDFQGDYDFDIGPPTSQANRQQAQQDLLQIYTLAMQNPLSMQNPAIILALSRKILEKYGYPDIAMLLPDPEQMMPPISAELENTMMMQGQDVDPHPADNHIEHIAKHQSALDRIKQTEQASPGFLFSVGGWELPGRFQSHIAEHQQAMKTQGGSINMMGRGAPMGGGGMVAGGAQPPMPQLPMAQGAGPTNPASNPAQAGLAGILNSGNLNLG